MSISSFINIYYTNKQRQTVIGAILLTNEKKSETEKQRNRQRRYGSRTNKQAERHERQKNRKKHLQNNTYAILSYNKT